ncbi:MAG TPA: hypothetical protein VFY84_16720 [Jiangellales bacterium]|nr:hypothetical protein [Jiangellales bacterium]
MWPLRRRLTLPTIDPALGDRAAAGLHAHLTRRDWRSSHDFLSSVDHPDDLAFYVGVASATPGLQAWIHEWTSAEPRSFLPVLVRGAHAIEWAWQARGGARAKETSGAQFRLFAQRLKLAEDCLNEAVEREPDDPTAWALLIRTAVGRELGPAEARRRFAEAIARHRWHYRAHRLLLMQLCAKWGGSHEEMHQFADASAGAAPPGSPLGALIADAHLERWLDLPNGQDRVYMRRPDVRTALHEAADRSVRHPAYERRPGWPIAHNAFAMAFWLADEHDAAAEQFDAVGDLVTERPWYYHGEPAERFARARADSYARRVAVRA